MGRVPSLCVLCNPVIQGGAMANFGHCTTRLGEKHLAQLVGEGACQPVIFTKYRLGCELSYGACIHSYV